MLYFTLQKSLSLICIVLLSLAFSPVSAEQPKLLRYEYTQIHMGVQARIVLYAKDREQAESAVIAAFHRFAQLEDIMSDYRPTSELMRLCKKSGRSPVSISSELLLVLEKAEELAERSHGAFDVTVSPLVKLWRTARKTRVLPSKEEIQRAKNRVGWQYLKLNKEKQTAQLLRPDMLLDLGGIAKGYAGDEAQTILKKHGIQSALVEAGGDIVVSNSPPNEKGWRIEIEQPLKGSDKYLVVSNCAVSTSGDTAQFVEIGGRYYSHIVDPKTGYGLSDHIAVTVVAPNGLTSDALSTAISVLGRRRGLRLVKQYLGVSASIRYVAPPSPALDPEITPLLPP